MKKSKIVGVVIGILLIALGIYLYFWQTDVFAAKSAAFDPGLEEANYEAFEEALFSMNFSNALRFVGIGSAVVGLFMALYSLFTIKQKEKNKFAAYSVRTIVAIGFGSALFFFIGRFASIPVFANTTITFQYAVLAFFAVVFGPVAGLFIGLIGHTLIDLSSWGVWWSWIVTSGLVGLATGLVCRGIKVNEGVFRGKDIVKFIICNIVVHIVAWVGIAPALDYLIYQEPTTKILTQGLIAAGGNLVSTVILGTLFLFLYSKTKVKTGSLVKEG